MRVAKHVAISAALAAAIYAEAGSPFAATASFLAGWVIDADHLLDYAMEHGMRFDRLHFFATFREDRYRKARLVLHGWEWPIALVAVSWRLGGNTITAGLAFGWLQHLLFDQLTNKARPLAYSLVARAVKRFDYQTFFPSSRRHS